MSILRYLTELFIAFCVVVVGTYATFSYFERDRKAAFNPAAADCRDQDHGIPLQVGDTLICAKGVVWVKPRECPFCDTVAPTPQQ